MSTIIVGGGWSGLAAAITLTQQGKNVTLIEAAPQLGGRARSLTWQDIEIDNGQHLLIGAYQQFLELLSVINANPDDLFERRPLDLTIYDDVYSPLSLSAANFLPWPVSIAYSLWRSADWDVLRCVIRLQRQITSVLKQPDQPLLQWLTETRQHARLIKQLWEPLCLGALNTPIDQASTHIFARVIQQSLMQGKQAADLLLPKQALAKIFPDLAAHFITQHGGEILLQTRVHKMNVNKGHIEGVILSDGSQLKADNIILATALTESIRLTDTHLKWYQPQHHPITTIYLQYPSGYRLPKPILGSSGSLLQWLFDRNDLNPGLMAAVISGPGLHQTMTKDQLVAHICNEIQRLFPYFPRQAQSYRVIQEKRATFVSSVDIDQQRPRAKTSISGLWLAGDFVANNLPATLEGAVNNGIQCANLLLEVDNIG